jgi:sec-independent protein translocase protein TatA
VNNLNQLAFMGPIGLQEMVVIFLIILLLFGAKKIPELARGIGKGMGEFKKAKEDFEHEIKHGEEEGKKEWEQPSKPVDAPAPAPASAPTPKSANKPEPKGSETDD